MAFIFLGCALFLVYSACLVFYRQAWVALPEFRVSPEFQPRTKISVIIPARNEEENIAPCLDSVLRQDYPTDLFEVIVVDDHSTDKTALKVREAGGGRVRLLALQDHLEAGSRLNAYKKKAIETAVGLSTGQLIVTTDADCLVQRNWLRLFACCFESAGPVFIAAPVAYTGETSFLGRFQSLDFMTLQGITGASVYKKFHTMCNGANLAYSRAVFDEVGGFRNIDAIASGDDMLLMHKMYRLYPERITFLKSPEAIVRTLPMPDWRSFFNQRVRWASKADKYDDKRIFPVLFLVYCWNLWFPVAAVWACFQPRLGLAALGLLALKTVVEMWYLQPVARFFGKEKLLWYFPIAQPVHILYTVIAGWLGKFGTYQWKGRRVR